MSGTSKLSSGLFMVLSIEERNVNGGQFQLKCLNMFLCLNEGKV